jgi:DNA-binding NarL/FixJ family response regulator
VSLISDKQPKRQERVAVMFNRYPLLLDALDTILRTRITIAAKVTSTGEAIEMITKHQPDVLIAGIEAAVDSEEALKLVRDALISRPGLKVIALSSGSESQILIDAFEAGVTAFIAQNASPDDIAVAIRQATDPSIHFAPQHLPAAKAESPIAVEDPLTEREIETVRLVAQGLSNAEVGRTLLVTEQTVKFHLSNIFRKLNVSNRTQASRRAQMLNLLAEETADVSESAIAQ